MSSDLNFDQFVQITLRLDLELRHRRDTRRRPITCCGSVIDVEMSPSGGSWPRYGAGASKLPVPVKFSLTSLRHIAPIDSSGSAAGRYIAPIAPADAERGAAEMRGAAIGAEEDVLLELDGRRHDVDAGADA